MNNKGIALVTVLIIVGIMMVLISILYFSINTDYFLNRNFKSYIMNFYYADGAVKIEDVKVITLNVPNISEPNILESGSATFPGTNVNYQYLIRYEFYKQNITPGTSLNMFNDYFYSVNSDVNNVKVKEFISKIGPTIH